jgi:hypothetical protein
MTEIQKLQTFKAYVHKRLDAMGVPENPEPATTLETGCRIGPRLDWIAARINRLRSELRELRGIDEEGCGIDHP